MARKKDRFDKIAERKVNRWAGMHMSYEDWAKHIAAAFRRVDKAAYKRGCKVECDAEQESR